MAWLPVTSQLNGSEPGRSGDDAYGKHPSKVGNKSNNQAALVYRVLLPLPLHRHGWGCLATVVKCDCPIRKLLVTRRTVAHKPQLSTPDAISRSTFM